MTLAELKRNAKQGNMVLELTERFGKTGDAIPEMMRGKRKVVGANSDGVNLLNHDGQVSKIHINSASLVEYDGETLMIYEAGIRDLNEEEQKILDESRKVQEDYYEQNPYGNAFWKLQEFFSRSTCPYMSGMEKKCGKRYLSHCSKVMDNAVRGPMILKYRVCFE